jgi:hypothetical protein
MYLNFSSLQESGGRKPLIATQKINLFSAHLPRCRREFRNCSRKIPKCSMGTLALISRQSEFGKTNASAFKRNKLTESSFAGNRIRLG